MIFHLLIVDDEAPMRKGLSSFINWEAIDCVVADTACDGLDAIEKIKEKQIDIILTDIKMPEMDGIALAKYVWENHLDIAVIILTGYAEFEYAQSAIRYNVVQFLLKPTSKDEVLAAVQNAQQSIITSKEKHAIAKNELAFLKDQFFQELTDSAPTPELFKRQEALGISLSGFYVAAFQLTRDSHTEISQLKNLIIEQKVNSYCYRYNNLIMTIYHYPCEGSTPTAILENCADISSMITALYSSQIVIGISQFHTGPEEFSVAAYEAIHALSLNFYSENNVAVFNDHNRQISFIPADTTLALYELENAMIQLDFVSASSIVKKLFIRLQSSFAQAETVKNISLQIYYIGYRVLAKRQLIPPSEDYFSRISGSADIYQLETIIEELLSAIRKSLTNCEKAFSRFTSDAMEYIKENLTKNITLEPIAEYAHVNESYLSRTFKKECGCSITEYITTLRIEKAKELLSRNDTRTYEVSEQVGFNDPSYFSLTFKKYTGLSPKDYRKQFHLRSASQGQN